MLNPILKNRKIILHIHDYIWPSRINRLMLKKIQKHQIKIIAVSNFIRKNLMNSGVPEEIITVIPNFIETDNNDTVLKKSSASNTFKIGIIGQVIPRKGHDILIDAFQQFSIQYPDIELHIAGTGDKSYIAQLKQTIREFSIQDKTKWLGFINNPASFYQSMNVIVVPTKGPEPFGLVAIEPMLYGVPVIVSDTGGLSEIITNGENGLKYENNSVSELKKCIEILFKKPAQRKFLVEMT
jgi:glycosyltransferase involved in cell wall biosynthesis